MELGENLFLLTLIPFDIDKEGGREESNSVIVLDGFRDERVD